MMTRLIRTAMMVAAAMLTTGCAVYNGTSTDIPLFQEKGELQVEAAFVPLGVTPIYLLPIPYRGTVSYSLTDEVGISASVDALRQTVQAMGGIYRPVDRRFVWELYGGLALGRGENSNPENNFSYTGRYMMPFVQVDCGWRDLTRWMHLDVAFALRAGGIFGQTEYTEYGWDEYSTWVVQQDSFRGLRPMLEPSMEVRFGWSDLKFNVRFYRIFVLGNEHNHPCNLQDIPAMNGGMGVGMSYRF